MLEPAIQYAHVGVWQRTILVGLVLTFFYPLIMISIMNRNSLKWYACLQGAWNVMLAWQLAYESRNFNAAPLTLIVILGLYAFSIGLCFWVISRPHEWNGKPTWDHIICNTLTTWTICGLVTYRYVVLTRIVPVPDNPILQLLTQNYM